MINKIHLTTVLKFYDNSSSPAFLRSKNSEIEANMVPCTEEQPFQMSFALPLRHSSYSFFIGDNKYNGQK